MCDLRVRNALKTNFLISWIENKLDYADPTQIQPLLAVSHLSFLYWILVADLHELVADMLATAVTRIGHAGAAQKAGQSNRESKTSSSRVPLQHGARLIQIM